MSYARRPGVLVWCGFIAVSATIAGNALLLQPGRHPAPFVSTFEAEIAAPQRDELTVAVQTGLRERGYYTGALDGIAGAGTAAAIAAFERAAGLAPTGRPTEALLAALRQPAPQPEASRAEPAPQDQVQPAVPDERVAAVQAALARAAYGPLRADGVFGPQTRDAIRRFQADRKLPTTGEIDDALIAGLREVGAIEAQ
jgi:peptidoglycan hydrolase-like protein with peptidoglycan-binding domain